MRHWIYNDILKVEACDMIIKKYLQDEYEKAPPMIGDGGGEIVAAGPVQQILKEKRSHTAKYLAEALKKRPKP